MAYQLEGSLLEFCDCNAICPCWIGEDPDNGTCSVAAAWHFDSGTIDGVDVSGLTLGAIAHIPGNILEGNWRAVVVMDERATPQQEEAILKVFTGQLGGPVADVVKLIGEVVAVERAPITFEADKGKGTLKIGQAVDAEMVPYVSPHTGEPTMLYNSVFSDIGGGPMYPGKAPTYKVNNPALGINLELSGKSVIQGKFKFVL